MVTGKLKAINNDISTREINITLVINEKLEAIELFNELRDIEKLSIEIKKYHKKRSLDSNAYAWTLMSAIATVLKTSKDAIYELMLQSYGAVAKDDDGNGIKISLLAAIDVERLGIHVKYIGESEASDKLFKHYLVLIGSSEYDTKQMSEFIEGIVYEAKELGIETLTPEELEQMNKAWKARKL